MSKHSCEKCRFRAKFDNNPSSFMGKLWRWHTNWCPGWKRYLESIPEEDRTIIIEKYGKKRS
ncbi:MAG: hypothetical protein RBR67_02125 [Desulfobacterium sp.]|nr:hypothetical protein [Desulfobacterium sp.]